MKRRIKELVKELGAKRCKKGLVWKGYQVYELVDKGNPCIGHPYVILQKVGETRISTEEESLEYLNYEISIEKMNELEKLGDQILSGKYNDSEEIVARYKRLKKELTELGVMTLDGLDFDNIIFHDKGVII